MLSAIGKLFLKLWMRQFKKKQIEPTVRAVFLGDGISLNIMADGVFSKNELDLLRDEVFPKLPHSKMALDIGANIGNHAVTFAKHFDVVKAYEINKRVFHILQSNTVNTNVQPINYGLSDEEKTVFFEEDYGNLGASSIVDTATDTSFEVEVKALDSILTEAEKAEVSFIKMDVEGHELNVLNGGKQFLEKYHPVIAFEGYFKESPKLGIAIQERLSSLGYVEFLELEYHNSFIRMCKKTLPKALFKIARYTVFKAQREKFQLAHTDQLTGKDHILIIASAYPLIA